jgi:hypothetical protein
VFHPWQDLAFRRPVARELIGDDDTWHVLQALQQLAEKLLRRLLVAPVLDQDVEPVVVLIDGAPQVMALPAEREARPYPDGIPRALPSPRVSARSQLLPKSVAVSVP